MTIFILTLGCDSDDNNQNPTGPPMPTVTPASASFRISGAGYDDAFAFDRGSNLVFCRQNAGWADLWIRFAEEAAGNGEASPHIDIDVCNYADGGTFAPQDPNRASCDGSSTFDIWWHDGDLVFVNEARSSPCSLSLSFDAATNELMGSFSCSGLRERGGSRSLDILDGSFMCPVE